jgi:hypothetical protein
MSEFQAALERTLKGVSSPFAAADADLHQEVVSAGNDVSSITNGKATLELVPHDETQDHYVYDLVLASGENQWPVAEFKVPVDGYPILAGPTQLNNRQELVKYFTAMAANPHSSLVKRLAFLLRQS